MKPLFYLQRPILICSVLAATLMLGACGQTGPLYMPRVPADPDAPPGTATVPASGMPAIQQQQQQRMPLPGSNNATAPSSVTPNPFPR